QQRAQIEMELRLRYLGRFRKYHRCDGCDVAGPLQRRTRRFARWHRHAGCPQSSAGTTETGPNHEQRARQQHESDKSLVSLLDTSYSAKAHGSAQVNDGELGVAELHTEPRSEERRGGKECRSRRAPEQERKK